MQNWGDVGINYARSVNVQWLTNGPLFSDIMQ